MPKPRPDAARSLVSLPRPLRAVPRRGLRGGQLLSLVASRGLVLGEAANGETMGQPVVHFEIIGTDGSGLQRYYSELFGWDIDADNPMNYGMVGREGNVNSDGVGIGAASGPARRATRATSPCTW